MAATSRTGLFFERKTSCTTDYKDQSYELKSSMRVLKVSVVGGDLEFSLNGNDSTHLDGRIHASDGMVTFEGLDFNRIAFRQASGTISEVRVWAHH